MSYCLGLQGPAVCVNTACSSSLVALDTATMALTLGKIVQAVVVGVSVMLSPLGFVATCKAGMLSPDGRCKTFDAGADGFARGEGCGAVVVKRTADVDTLHAVLRGVAVNQDGRSAGLTAPSGPAQVAAIRAALSTAGSSAGDISFVETHGTGTPLGDPIETGALSEALRDSAHEVILGAVKTHLGHCEAAAGMAGLLKTIMVLKHRVAPGNLHLQELNPLIDVSGGFNPVFPKREEPLRLGEQESALAGLSSFGFSGTNAHVLVQSVSDVARVRKPIRKRVAFLCTGQGSQYPQMGQDYMETEPVFRAAMEKCAKILSGVLDKELLEVIYGAGDVELINQTRYAQPALFALEYSLAELWRSHGVVPDVIMGHSLGEYVAACISGLISLESALVLVARRAELMAALPSNGTMAAVFHSEESVSAALAESSLGSQACIACINGPKACVISGTSDAVEQLQEKLGGAVKSLNVSHAFHSPLMSPMVDDFAALLAEIEPGTEEQAVKFISNMRGADNPPSSQHWVKHVTEPVDFLGGMHDTVDSGCEMLIELGPTPTLVKMGRRCVESNDLTWVSSMVPGSSSGQFAAVLATVFDADCHNFDAVSLPWHRDVLPHPILQRSAQETAAITRATGLNGSHVIGSATEAAMESLQQHVIDGAAVFPAAAMLDSAAIAIQHTHGSAVAVTLRDVVFQRPLQLLSDRARVCVSLDGSQVCFSSHAYRDDAPEVVHMVSAFETGVATAAGSEDVGTLFQGLVQADVDGFYAQASANGLAYGDDFRGITELWAFDASSELESTVSEGTVVGKLRPASRSGVWRQCNWDPTVLDALFQLNIALSPWEALIPFSISHMEILAPIRAGTLYGRATLRHSSPGVQVSDLTLMDSVGTVLVSVQGFEVRKPAVESILRGCAWSVSWEAAQSDWDGTVEAAELQDCGTVLLLSQGQVNSSRFADGANVCDLSTANAELLKRGWTACVVLLEPSEDPCEDPLLSVLRLVNLAHDIGFSDPLWIVTEGAQGEKITSPKLAGLWGLVRTARIEMPQLHLGCLDISPNSSPTLCRWQVQQDPHVEPEVSIYDVGDDSVRRVPRLREVLAPSPEAASFDGGRTFVITGGLSGFGLRTAVWMCERGAKHFALLSRSGAVQESDASSVADWKRLQSFPDVSACALACDISDADAVRLALEQIEGNGMPPLGGVIHAAGVLSDALLEKQSAESLRAVHAPKVDGVYNLHEATASCDPPLQIFVVFSSVAGVLGSAAQANYAAANSCLDAFVEWRRSLGLPACSLAWGPLAEVGMAARHGTAKRVRAHGLGELPVAAAFAALELALTAGAPSTVLAVPAEWDRWVARFPLSEPFLRQAVPVAAAPTVSSLPRSTTRSEPTGRPAGVVAPQLDVRSTILSSIEQLIGAAGASQLEDGSELQQCGLDSLGTMELRQGLSRSLKVTLSPSFLTELPTLAELVGFIERELPAAALDDIVTAVPAAPAGASSDAPTSARSLCQVWDSSIAPDVTVAAAAFFGGVAPVLLGPTTALGSATPQTTVIVIGWAGASPQGLAPIVGWHRSQGSRVLQLVPSLVGDLDAECYKALDVLAEDPKVLAGRCFLHCFSNNSMFFLRRMLSEHPQPMERPRLLPLRGLIVDSAPHPCADAAAVDVSGPVALQAHLAASLGVPASATVQEAEAAEGGSVELLEALAEAHWKRRRSQAVGSAIGPIVLPGGIPRLCVYGSLDTVVKPLAVTTWLEEERQRGERVEAVELRSGHVAHHLQHTEAYWAAVSRFVAANSQ